MHYDLHTFRQLPSEVRQRILDQYIEFKANEYLFDNEYVDLHNYQPTTDQPLNRFALDKEWTSNIFHYFNYEEHLRVHIDKSAEEQLLLGDD